MRYAQGTPSWVDLGSTDVDGSVAFYGRLFGWTADDLGPEAGGYRIFRKDGRQVAGLGPASDPARGSSWATYLAATDLDDVARKVDEHGGRVVVPAMDVMDAGRMAVFTDPTGAYFNGWQASRHEGFELANEPGSVTWNELMTADLDASKVFYQEVFGIDERDVAMAEGMTYTLLEVGGRPVAGAMPIDPAWGPMPSHWSVYFAVDDCDSAFAQALELGANKIMPPENSPAGRFAILSDPQGAGFSIIRNNPDFTI
ncbi:putative glyoxylase CFP32 [Catellatospora sp. TT07R-123]|uniref:VOC family protein n=1 Tax=Catellatospora sp. TT07R-123 TaxID=2733863 RepID=UPI001B289D14|nr:VOC family protein [Catellatospora sp. TT07R-123]GHJ45832.1 putative glyoxylase CFP32 [Catellatospora sp. TT07R-123]